MPVRATTPSACRYPATWIFMVSLVLMFFSDREPLAGEPPTGHSYLSATSWTASAYSRHAGGIICWLPGKDGSLRIEISEGPAVSVGPASGSGTDPLENLESVLTWAGDGWTMILGPDDSGTLNAWGREWRHVPLGLAQMARLVTVALHDYPARRPEFSFASSTGLSCQWARIPQPHFLVSPVIPDRCESTWSYQLSPLELEDGGNIPQPVFRDNMVARGRGTGGRGEVVSLKWFSQPGIERYGLVITSSRRPGTLRLEPPRDLAVNTPEPEVFAPLWPLSQFIETR